VSHFIFQEFFLFSYLAVSCLQKPAEQPGQHFTAPIVNLVSEDVVGHVKSRTLKNSALINKMNQSNND
jgi:hypothetical protein